MSDQDELEKIKQRKLRQILERAEQMQSTKAKLEKETKEQATEVKKARMQILSRILEPDANKYLAQLRDSKPEIAQRIENIILSLFLQKQLISVSKVQIRALERRLEGVEPSIMVKRRGKKMKSLSDAIRKEDE
ncbi:MAG: DNA-binding protein [Candidatus Heimdallarchaeota archaeon]